MKKKFLTVLLALAAALCLCFELVACGGGHGIQRGNESDNGSNDSNTDVWIHTHNAENFEVDDSSHWKICDCGEKFSVGNHSYNSFGACKICGYSTNYTEGLEYVYSSYTYTVKGLGNATNVTNLVIPAYYQGKAVTLIDSYAFKKCKTLISVTMGCNVTRVEWGAFEACSGLKKVITTNLAAWCKINFDNNTANPLNYAHHLYLGEEEVKELTIPDTVESIGEWAFFSCSGITSITIPDSVTGIGSSAFTGTAYYEDETNWDSNGLYIGNHLVAAKVFSGEYTIKQGTKTIADNLFEDCKLTSITIPDSVTSIGYWMFCSCSELTSVTIGSGVTEIRSYAFYGCNRLSSIVIPDGVSKIGDSAFQDCDELASITIPDSVIMIGERAFEGTAYYNDATKWDNDGILYIGNHLIAAKDTISGAYTINYDTKTIADRAFSGCYGLTNIAIPDSVTSIGGDAFYGCDGLTSVTIPNGVTSIGSSAFRDCNGLTSITIPDSVTSIGGYAFYRSNKLNTIYYNGAIKKWKEIGGIKSKPSDQTIVRCTDGDCNGNGEPASNR